MFGNKTRLLCILLMIIILTMIITGCKEKDAQEVTSIEEPPNIGLVKVGVSPGWEPFEQVDPNSGEPVGFDIDLMKTMASEAGFQVEFVQVPFDSLLSGLGSDYDIAISALLVNDEREEKYLLSEGYMKIGLVLIIPLWNRAVWGPDNIKGKKAAALKGSLGENEIIKIDSSALVLFEDNDAMFEALIAEKRSIDIIVTDYLTGMEYISKTPGSLKLSAPFTSGELVIAITESRKDILAAVNYGLKKANDNYLVKDVITDWIAVSPNNRPAGFILNGGR